MIACLRQFMLALSGLRSRPVPLSALRHPTVVIAPHQDDEVLGCGGTIALLRDQGVDVDIVFLTDGSGSHKDFMSPQEMADVRQQEAIAAAGILGVAPSRVHFLSIASQKLTAQSDRATAELSVLLQALAAEQYFIPYHFETHVDHVAAARIARQALTAVVKPTAVWAYPVWFWDHYPWLAEPVFSPRGPAGRFKHSLVSLRRLLMDFDGRVDIAGAADRKRDALAAHVSQVKGLRDDVSWPVLDDVSGGDFSACFARSDELFASVRSEGS